MQVVETREMKFSEIDKEVNRIRKENPLCRVAWCDEGYIVFETATEYDIWKFNKRMKGSLCEWL